MTGEVIDRYNAILSRVPRPEELNEMTGPEGSYCKLNAVLMRAWQQRRTNHKTQVKATRPDLVPVLILLRNDELYVRNYLPGLMSRVRTAFMHHHLRAHFYLYENDSKDATPSLLQQIAAKDRDTMVCCEQLNHSSSGACRTNDRCTRMALYRNSIMGMALGDIQRSELTLCLDTNITFSEQTLHRMIDAITNQPQLGMALAMTEDLLTKYHYYDTYAYTCIKDRIKNASLHRFHCPVKECNSCTKSRSYMNKFVAKFSRDQKTLHYVASGFGGLALIRSRVLERVHWESKNNLCEHVAMCAMIRKLNWNIAIVPWAKATWVQELKAITNYRFQHVFNAHRKEPIIIPPEEVKITTRSQPKHHVNPSHQRRNAKRQFIRCMPRPIIDTDECDLQGNRTNTIDKRQFSYAHMLTPDEVATVIDSNQQPTQPGGRHVGHIGQRGREGGGGGERRNQQRERSGQRECENRRQMDSDVRVRAPRRSTCLRRGYVRL